MIRGTYTSAELEISEAAYNEIADKLRAAGYGDVIYEGAIDVRGLCLVKEKAPAANRAGPPGSVASPRAHRHTTD